ncbi:MAG TPA: V-type ATP synthase subunit F [Vicinamibacterales bacterium]|nr:V-type ATP synthase subunit F [Vicinamibacterales bacterium]
MKVRVVSRPAVAPAFELAGLAVRRADDGTAAAEAIRHWVSDAEVGIVLVDDALYRALPRELVTRLDRAALPVIAPVPAPRWDERSEAEAYVMEILRQAIGYRVRPR